MTSSISNGLVALYGSDERIINNNNNNGDMWDPCCYWYHSGTCVSLQHFGPMFLQLYPPCILRAAVTNCMQRGVLISCTISALFDGNLSYVNTRFGLPKIVLKIGEIVRDRVTIFLLDGSLDACVILPCRGIIEKLCR